jgi:hypothetical protein
MGFLKIIALVLATAMPTTAVIANESGLRFKTDSSITDSKDTVAGEYDIYLGEKIDGYGIDGDPAGYSYNIVPSEDVFAVDVADVAESYDTYIINGSGASSDRPTAKGYVVDIGD